MQSAAEFQKRIESLHSQMEARKLTHILIYADREHFANLAYLTAFDPRYEEALLIVVHDRSPMMLVGNECESYLGISPLFNEGHLRTERFQTFSLLNQPREQGRHLREILADENIGPDSSVGCVGWKYFSAAEHPNSQHALDVPSYIADTLRDLASRDHVYNVTDIFMHPGHGLRTSCSPSDIAYFEYSNVLASESLKRMIFGLREGMTDFDLVELARLNGEPLGCHPTCCTGRSAPLGVASPSGEIIRRGQPLSTNICFLGSNICRAGWIAEGAQDLPENARDYVQNFAGRYFEVMRDWFDLMRIGVSGGEIWQLIQDRLPFEQFGIFLNPGHLIHLDEWVSSPMYRNSDVTLHSGMAIQVDVIPSSYVYFSTRMEDGIILADSDLRQQLREDWPDCYERCQKRRSFMSQILGIELPTEVLPLSNIPAIVPPYLLSANTVIALES